ncbi:FAD-binding oxidoreductase [Stigmatella hybrida]|uniref:FAD-binding oxidoreductase n=1 Tax=Stigmatella hybrida TaxID=394097 RepID=UPI001CDAE59E|nr:FAD-binding protein [Stigmatella hybrida]
MEQTIDGMKIVTAEPVSNWFNDIHTHPRVIAYPTHPRHLQRIVRDTQRFPSPLRAVGSIHSTTACFEADTGTVVVMKAFNHMSLGVDAEGNPTVTAGAGARFFEVAEFLCSHQLQFYVNVEIGDLTMGAAACVGTKESAFPGEHGQVSSYLRSAKMVNAQGECVEIPSLTHGLDLQTLRSSYGLLGFVYEVTFKVKKLTAMAVRHRTFTLQEFTAFLQTGMKDLEKQGTSIMFYLDPFTRKHLFMGPRGLITAELRTYVDADPAASTRWQWKLRNLVWRDAAPRFSHLVARFVPFRFLRNALLNTANWVNHFFLRTVIRGRNTQPTAQIIRYPHKGGPGKYTFSILAFPEKGYPELLSWYFEFCQRYEAKHGYRSNLLNVGYRTFQDQSSLLSYSYQGNAMTADPVSTGTPGWKEFLAEYHALAEKHGGAPLFNQTPGVTAASAWQAFGERLREFARIRAQLDPTGRFLNPFFKALLEEPFPRQLARPMRRAG